MTGFHAGGLLVAVLCLAGAVAAAVALPGRGFTRDTASDAEAEGGPSPLVAVAETP
jgi:hypothetical protein